MSHRSRWSCLVLCALAGLAAPASAQVPYRVVDIGIGNALGINNNNQVTGYLGNPNAVSGATAANLFLYNLSTNTTTNLGTLGNTSAQARGINDGGVIFGYTSTGLGARGDTTSVDTAFIRDAGGTVTTITGGNTPSLAGYDKGTRPVPPGYNSAEAFGNNDGGLVVGRVSNLGGNPTAGFRYNGQTNTTTIIAPINPGASGGQATADDINNPGQTVGFFTVNAADTRHGFLLAGNSNTPVDLNTLIASNPANLVIEEAYAINDSGVIVGIGRDNGPNGGAQHAILLVPVPEPASLLLGGAGCVGLAGLVWRRRVRAAAKR